MITLCDRHYAILRFLREFRDEHGYAASMREIGRGVDISSTSMIRYYLEGLEYAGLIKRDPYVARSVVLTGRGQAESYKDIAPNHVIKASLFREP